MNFFLVGIWGFSLVAFGGTTRQAASPAQSDVRAVYEQSAAGDIIEVPGGDAIWKERLVLDRPIWIRSTAPVVIRDGRHGFDEASDTIITIFGSKARLTGFTFTGDGGGGGAWGSIILYGKDNLIEFCRFDAMPDYAAIHVYGERNVVRRCYAYTTGTKHFINFEYTEVRYGDDSWSETVPWGTTNRFSFVEACYLTNNNDAALTDAFSGAYWCLRYTIVHNGVIEMGHGTDSSQRKRGTRAFEGYDNVLISRPMSAKQAFNLRSGTATLVDNYVEGYPYFALGNNYRDAARFGATINGVYYAPFGGATGQGIWDKNATNLILSGTHTGGASPALVDSSMAWLANQYQFHSVRSGSFWATIISNGTNSLECMPTNVWKTGQAYEIHAPFGDFKATAPGTTFVVAGAGWRKDQWRGYTLVKPVGHTFGSMAEQPLARFSIVLGNTEDAMTYQPSPIASEGYMTFEPGDRALLFRVEQVLDGIGMGAGVLLSGDQPPYNAIIPTGWPEQALDPVFSWNNVHIYEGMTQPGEFFGQNNDPTIRANEHFINNVERPGYQKLAFPHPLVAQLDQYYGVDAPVILGHPENVDAVRGQRVVFESEAGGTPPLRYQWLRNGVDIPGAIQASYVIPVVDFSDPGAFSVRVSNNVGSVASREAHLAVSSAPALLFNGVYGTGAR